MKHNGTPRSTQLGEGKQSLNDKIYSSLLAKRFRRFVNWLYSLLINGFFGKIFTAYSAEEELFFNSRIYRVFSGANRVRRVASDVKSRMARLFESSRILKGLGNLTASLIHRRVKTYGAFLLALGGYGLVTHLVRVLILAMASIDLSVILTCLGFVLFGMIMLASQETFAEAAQKSRLMRVILFDWLGIPRDTFLTKQTFPKRYKSVVAFGMLLGALTFFVHPAYYILAALVLLAVALIFGFPEIGVLGMVALVPLSSLFSHPSIVLLTVVLLTGISYYIKVIRGKRVFKLNLIDAAIFMFAVILLLSGVFSAGGTASTLSALLYFALLMGYFLTVNLIRTKDWVRRCVGTFLIFAALISVVGVAQFFTGTVNVSWVDIKIFSDIGVRITATFDNPNVYASYLLLVIPFVSTFLLRRGTSTPKIPSLICLILLGWCLVETWSRGAWLGAIAAFVLFLLIYSRHSVAYLLLGGALLPTVVWVLPNAVVSRFVSIGSASDSSSLYRISAWRGVGQMLKENWLGGIGVGESAFSTVYPAFSYAGIEGIHHTHNLYLQIFSETGIVGLLVFVFVLILFVQNCFEFIYKTRNRGEKTVVIAGMTAIAASLVMGLTDHIWYSYRVFLMFWVVIGIVNAYIRIGLAELKRFDHYENNSFYSVDFDLNVDNL